MFTEPSTRPSQLRLPALSGAQQVVFKLLQAVRLAVDGSAESANAVGSDAAFVAKVGVLCIHYSAYSST